MLLLVPVSLPAQDPPKRALGKPLAEFTEPFTSASSIRELRDGRVIVADSREKTLQLIDLASGTATKIGREGGGPTEYMMPTRLYAVGDSAWLYDQGNDRFLVISASGVARATRPLGLDALARVQGIRGVDLQGRVVARTRSSDVLNGPDTDEWLIRVPGAVKKADTIAKLSLPRDRHTGASTLGGGMLRLMNNKPFASEDVAAVAPDGRVAVVRSADYHVEWYLPDGKRVSGAPVAFKPIALSRAEKIAFLKRQIVPGTITVRGNAGSGSGGGAKAMPRSATQPDPGNPDSFEWPATIPPFIGNAATIAPDGALWVLRTRAHDDPIPSYDVFDAAGKLTSRVALPARTRLVGFGKGVVYLARMDDDDLEYLGRYKL
jgi:hypothetical protein